MPGKNTRLAVVGFSNLTTVYKYLTDVNSTNDAVAAIDSIAYAGDQFVNLEKCVSFYLLILCRSLVKFLAAIGG